MIFGKMNLSVSHPPPYKRKVGDYLKQKKMQYVQLFSITYCIYTAFEEFPSRETHAVFLDISWAFTMSGMKVCSLSSNVMVYQVPSSS